MRAPAGDTQGRRAVSLTRQRRPTPPGGRPAQSCAPVWPFSLPPRCSANKRATVREPPASVRTPPPAHISTAVDALVAALVIGCALVGGGGGPGPIWRWSPGPVSDRARYSRGLCSGPRLPGSQAPRLPGSQAPGSRPRGWARGQAGVGSNGSEGVVGAAVCSLGPMKFRLAMPTGGCNGKWASRGVVPAS